MSDDSTKNASPRKIDAVIDRIEDGGMAVLAFGDADNATVDFPVALLPEGASDGDHLRITITLDHASRAAVKASVKATQERLEKRSGTQGQTDFKL